LVTGRLACLVRHEIPVRRPRNFGLENFPGQPDAGTLRRLAAALRTTPGALLGAGAETPAGRDPGPAGLSETIPPGECRRLIAAGGIGRIAFPTASGLMVLPVNYVVVNSTIVLRTGAGSLIAAHGDDAVSFEVDHIDEALRQGWSVLVRGQAHRVLQRGELQHLCESCDLRPWPVGEHDLFVRILPIRITGRRIRSQ
jgi:nitroimidazol reductase NimA-like FMN-containing flavoprotein (pyridoxamine 5'-phosphate oxidase superfamily)